MAKMIRVTHECSGCSKFFVKGFEFPPKYECGDCDTKWEKEEGRQCESCHKFGRNPDNPICPDCDTEVDPIDKEVDPDEEDIMGEDGNEVVTVKKAKTRKTNAQKQEAMEEERRMRREKYDRIFNDGIEKHVIKSFPRLLGMSGEKVVAFRTVKALDSVLLLFASCGLSPGFTFDGRGEPFEVTYSINSDGYKSKSGASRNGFSYSIADSETFSDIDKMVAHAENRIEKEISI